MIPSKKKLTINYADGSSKILSLQTNKNIIWPYLWKFKTKDQIKQEQTSCVELNDVREQESKGRSLEVGQGTEGLLHLFSNRVARSAWKHDWIGRLGNVHKKWKAMVAWKMFPCESGAIVNSGSDQHFWET